ncbi:MAG: hypothetical protein ACE5F1_17505, partial [Planctomycetota bacterium]
MVRDMRRSALTLSCFLFCPLGLLPAQNPNIPAYLAEARSRIAEGRFDAAQEAVLRALERDARNLVALRLLVDVAKERRDQDLAVYTLHQLLEIAERDHAKSVRDSAREELESLDREASSYRRLRDRYLRELCRLARAYEARK